MRRYRASRSATRGMGRVKKPRPIVSVKTKVAKRGGKCMGCKRRFAVGDEVTYVRIKKRAFHAHICVPPNVHQLPTTMSNSTPELPKSAGEAGLFAMVSLENALVRKAQAQGESFFTPEVEKAFDRYNKLKNMSLRPGSDQEGRQALKLAILELVKIVFGA